jgi:hypothetical protein
MDTKRATEGPAGVLDSTLRIPKKRNAIDTPGSAAAVESRLEMRVSWSACQPKTVGLQLLKC